MRAVLSFISSSKAFTNPCILLTPSSTSATISSPCLLSVTIREPAVQCSSNSITETDTHKIFLNQIFCVIPFRWLRSASASVKDRWLSFSLFNLRSVSSSNFLQLRILAISTGGWKKNKFTLQQHTICFFPTFEKLTNDVQIVIMICGVLGNRLVHNLHSHLRHIIIIICWQSNWGRLSYDKTFSILP